MTSATLDAVPANTVVSILDLGTDSSLATLLTGRGMNPGATVIVLAASDPMLLAVGDSRWALSRRDASNVEVVTIGTVRPRTARLPALS